MTQLAVGGMSELYLATSIDRPEEVVVLKILRSFLQADQEIVAMFRDEISLMQKIQHKNIVKCLDANTNSSKAQLYLVLEYLPGYNLSQLTKHLQQSKRIFEIKQVLAIGYGILSALCYLHQETTPDGTLLSVIHRDLSPPNILLTTDGQIKVIDFGIALSSSMTRQTSGEDPKGKFSYIPPELLEGKRIDQRADLYSWGVIVWELLSGERLFQGNPDQVLKKIQETPIPLISNKRSDTPNNLVHFLAKTLSKDREKRFRTAQEMRGEFEQILQQNRCVPQSVKLEKLIHKRKNL